MNNAFLTWVNSSECFNLLRLCAKQVSKRAKRLEIVLDDAYLETENRDDYLNAVASDLTAFLLDPNRSELIARKATELLVCGDDDAFMAFLCREYLDYCIDQRREKSPFHAYYRHMRTVLSAEGLTRFHPQQRKASCYACTQAADLELLPEDPDRQNYQVWRVCDAVDLRDIHHKPAMLLLARHFWGEALREFLKEYLLPVRELVTFVAAKYPLLLTVEYASDQEEQTDGDEAGSSLENRCVDHTATFAFDDAWKRQLPVMEADIVDSHLDTLAQDCVAELTTQERLILQRLDEDNALDSIAIELGMKGPSNVSYHQKKAYTKLRTKWSLWGPPLLRQFGEVDEEEFFMFYEKVITFCKNEKACRDSRKGTVA